MSDRTTVILALELAAAKAAKLAADAKANKLWPGEVASGCAEIHAALNDAERNSPPGW